MIAILYWVRDHLFQLLLGICVIESVYFFLFRPADWRSSACSLAHFLLRVFVFSFPIMFLIQMMEFAWAHRIFSFGETTPMILLLLMFGVDFVLYCHHRASHRIRFLWIFHQVHHSASDLTFFTAVRMGWLSRFSGLIFFLMILSWIGFRPIDIGMMNAVLVSAQIFSHNHYCPKLGWLEYVIVTPASHRVHHARNPQYLDSNYSSIFIVFDRLFGTFKELSAPPEYGLVGGRVIHNPFQLEFDPWIDLWRDLRSANSYKEFLFYLIKPPGWKPQALNLADGGETSLRTVSQSLAR